VFFHPSVANCCRRLQPGIPDTAVENPFELKKLHYEIANSTISAPAMAAITALVPPSQLLFGTDFPYVPMEKTLGGLAELGYAPEMLRAINRNNAERLFPRFKA
jgi:predicted TIM-barrel fold metal-dependent hydrolase